MRVTKILFIGMSAVLLAATGCEPAAPSEAEALSVDKSEGALSLGNGRELDFDCEYGRLNFEESYTTRNGHTIRYKTYNYLGNPEAYVIFLNGRTEFIEKYEPLFTSVYEMPWETSPEQTLADLPVTFITMDHEGQGLSSGLPSHIDSYDTFVQNLHDFITDLKIVKKGKNRKPIYLMSHSMGGLISARYAETYPNEIDGLILSSPMFGMNAPAPFTSQQLKDLAGAFARPLPKTDTDPAEETGLGLADRCSRVIDPQVLALIAMCLGDPTPDTTCGPCFLDPSQETCFFAPYNMPLGAETMTAMRTSLAYLKSDEAIGCHQTRTPEYSCTFPGEGFNGTSSNFEYCMWTENNPLAGPNMTFGWVWQSFLAIDAMNANLDKIRDIPALVISTPIDPIVTATTHGAFCSELEDCTLVELQSNFQTGPIYFHELLDETDRASAVSAIRGFLVDRLGL